MQQEAPVSQTATAPKQQIPLHLVERLESEWKQMRDSAPTPAKAADQSFLLPLGRRCPKGR